MPLRLDSSFRWNDGWLETGLRRYDDKDDSYPGSLPEYSSIAAKLKRGANDMGAEIVQVVQRSANEDGNKVSASLQ